MGVDPSSPTRWPQSDAATSDYTVQNGPSEQPSSSLGTAADTAYELIIGTGIKETDLEDHNESQPAPAAPASQDEPWLPHEAVKVLYKLAEKREDIQDARVFRLQPVKGAYTNRVFECLWAREHVGKRPKKVLVRVYGNGSNLLFHREDEVATFEQMSARKQGPRLLGRFSNGRVEEFLHARTLTAEDLRNRDISARIAVKLREFHKLDMSGPKEPKLWGRLREWLSIALELATAEQVQKHGLQNLGGEIASLKLQLDELGSVVGFCHNDLQNGNIMMNEDDNSVTLIDYEYSSYNPIAYDIANHFCEMTANYQTETPHVLDFSRYPDFTERQRFVTNYLQASQGPGSLENQSEVESLVKEVEYYKLVSHLTWALWGIISANQSDIDFDFEEYSRQRFEQYRVSKDTIMGILGTKNVKCSTPSAKYNNIDSL